MNSPARKVSDDFRAMTEALEGLQGLADTIETTEPEVSVRTSRAKGCTVAGDSVPWCPEGVYLAERPSFTRDPAMHQGRYYVQDASSMFISHVIRQLLPALPAAPVVLDACAAPGGKTTAIIDALPDGALVVANEYVPVRAAVLRENVIKWGYEGTVVTRGDTRRLSKLRDTFDVVAIDAPCSGEGMMRKDEQAIAQWSPALIEECAERQRMIIANLWDTIAPGGYLIYSTCTYNRRENEEMVRHIIDTYGGESIAIDTDPSWQILPGIDTPDACYRFVPGHVRGEGLFMAVIRKGGERPERKERPAATRGKAPKLPPESAWLDTAEGLTLAETDGVLTAFPTAHAELLRRIAKCADVIHSGITVGELAGRAYSPTQSLAMSRRLRRGAFPEVEVSLDVALDYLRRLAVTLPPDSPRGYVLLTWQGAPLGFVKNLGNRANNLYPREWRILSSR